MKKEKGSLTLEASLVLPIFIFLFLFMYGIMMMFSGQQLISHALLQSGESLSLDSYSTEKLGDSNLESAKGAVNTLYEGLIANDSENKKYFMSNSKWYKSDNIKEEVKNRFLGYFCGGDTDRASGLLSVVGVQDGLKGLNFDKSYIDKNNDLHVIVTYEQKFLFDMNGRVSFTRKMEAVTHMWEL